MKTITLIAKNNNLDTNLLTQVKKLLNTPKTPQELEKNKAYDLEFDNPDNLNTQKLETLLYPKEIDYIIQDQATRSKKMLISDMDSTIIDCECIDELAAFVGLKDKISQITARAMNGELDFEEALRERVALLKDLEEDKLEQAYQNIPLMPGAESILKIAKENGIFCVLVSGGFTFFTQKIADHLNFDKNHGNVLEIQNNKLTGKVVGEILQKDSKVKYLQQYQNELELKNSEILAIGDGANDIPMLKEAGLGIAYHAKELVNQQIANRVKFNDLEALKFICNWD